MLERPRDMQRARSLLVLPGHGREVSRARDLRLGALGRAKGAPPVGVDMPPLHPE